MPDIAANLEQRGFCFVPKITGSDEIDGLKIALARSEIDRAERHGQTYGARNLLHLTEVHAVAASPKIMSTLQSLFGSAFRTVRGLFFDKTENANWPVPWHQDLSLAVQKRQDVPGWGKWTVKRGVTHVQPPPEILSRMITMRLHLDDCPAENGALRVIPESHRRGILRHDQVISEAERPFEIIPADAGDALFMRPLILHASSPALIPSHRRVLHLEFAPPDLLPKELAWADV
jgi:ectoine hydroxylase-related dioxygenase (phytanoyl-CoA dioxygenase family)